MALKGYESLDGLYWSIAIIVPVIIIGYWLSVQAESPEGSIVAFCFMNLGSTIFMTAVLFSLLRDIGASPRPWVVGIVLGIAFSQVLVVLLLVHDNMANNMVQASSAGMQGVLLREAFWEPLRYAQCAYLLAIAVTIIGIVAIVRADGKAYARRVPMSYTVLAGLGVAAFTLEPFLGLKFSLLPFIYATASAVVALSYDVVHSHDIASIISSEERHHAGRGYIALSLDGRFLSCNEQARAYLPELSQQRVDAAFDRESKVGSLVYDLIEDYTGKSAATASFRTGDMACACSMTGFTLRRGGDDQGYLIDIRDATHEQRALDILEDYNQTLNQEVQAQTAHVEQIQRKIVLGMANMIENRDSNTGGHVKRTSDVIQILVQEIQDQGFIKLDDALAHDIVRAAPMHDLGKMSIDSTILNKPGRLTPEEYEIMKTHSTTSGQMVMILLDGVEEEHFVKVAYNVARFHHERWDGKGYPEGLVGEMIPLEARIMAVADVYDALVSKRVYKEPMSFEAASAIMCEGMGTQFDPNMRLVFLACRSKLEEYYSTAD